MNLFKKKKESNEKRKIKPIFAFILGIILTTGTVFATTQIWARDVGFTSTSNISATNLQSAIESVYADVVNSGSGNSNMKYYKFPITSSQINGNAQLITNCSMTKALVEVQFSNVNNPHTEVGFGVSTGIYNSSTSAAFAPRNYNPVNGYGYTAILKDTPISFSNSSIKFLSDIEISAGSDGTNLLNLHFRLTNIRYYYSSSEGYGQVPGEDVKEYMNNGGKLVFIIEYPNNVDINSCTYNN